MFFHVVIFIPLFVLPILAAREGNLFRLLCCCRIRSIVSIPVVAEGYRRAVIHFIQVS